jgi:PAS domain S-box-containing protein
MRYVNRAFAHMMGFTPEEMIGKPNFYMKVMPDPDERSRLIEAVSASMRDSSMARTEAKFVRANGDKLDMLLTVSRLRESGTSAILRGVILARDISQEKALQEQKDRFIANASHELRTPLTNLKLRLYLLKAQPTKLNEHMTILESVTVRMQELVENLLDVSRFDRGVVRLKKTRVVLQKIISDVISHQQAHAEEKHINLHAEMPDTPLEGQVDPDRLSQVITNLVVNAINYTPQGGEVLVQIQKITLPDQPTEKLQIRIKDSGIGIPDHLQKHIFTPFFRANEGATRGTGLGLTIAQEIIALHDGTISLESTPNVGTTFTVLLPT